MVSCFCNYLVLYSKIIRKQSLKNITSHNLSYYTHLFIYDLFLSLHLVTSSWLLYFLTFSLFLLSSLPQAAMPSPVSELRGPNIKYHEASFLEDCTFQQVTPYIHALRDPVCNRVTLVGWCVFSRRQTNYFDL